MLLWVVGTAWNIAAFDQERLLAKRWQPDFSALPTPSVARILSLGFRPIVADYYWIMGVFYFGQQKNAQTLHAQLADYMDIVVELAPDFESAYRFAGMAIPTVRENEPWANVERAVSILERGADRFPDNWFLRLLLAYYYSAHLERYVEAADQLVLASKAYGAPAYFTSLATRLYAQAGDVSTAKLLAATILEDTDDPVIIDAMQQRLRELQVHQDLDALQAAVSAFRDQEGHLPSSLQDLVRHGLLNRLPAESLDGVFLYDRATGQVTSSMLPRRVFLHDKERMRD